MNPRQEKLLDWRRHGYGPKAKQNHRDRRNTMKNLFGAIKAEARQLHHGFINDIHHAPTFEEQVAKAGGRLVKVPSGKTTAEMWHELDQNC